MLLRRKIVHLLSNAAGRKELFLKVSTFAKHEYIVGKAQQK
jgi:hypothetical protein